MSNYTRRTMSCDIESCLFRFYSRIVVITIGGFFNVDKQLCSQRCVKEPEQVNNLYFCKFGLSKVYIQLSVTWMHCLTAVSQHIRRQNHVWEDDLRSGDLVNFLICFMKTGKCLFWRLNSHSWPAHDQMLLFVSWTKMSFCKYSFLIVECLILNEWSKWKFSEIHQNTFYFLLSKND